MMGQHFTYEGCEMSYNPDTGYLYRLVKRTNKWQQTACKPNGNGYAEVRFGTKLIKAHKVIYEVFIGNIPDGYDVDHIDRNRLNNSLSNLRLALRFQNNGNSAVPKHNTSGYKGVSYNSKRGKWEAHITKENRKINLGQFNSLEDALRTRHQAAKDYFKEFYNG